ncbi:hypothetical protein ASG86_15540 [Arthrobacter sp. Soil764]|nr:hypothetical protein ASG86_15540 [Arthrobacter sp. Soil764]
MGRSRLEAWVSIQLRQARTVYEQIIARFSGDTNTKHTTILVAEPLQVCWFPMFGVGFISRTLSRQMFIEDFQQSLAMTASVQLSGCRSVSQEKQHTRNQLYKVWYLVPRYPRPEPNESLAVGNVLN